MTAISLEPIGMTLEQSTEGVWSGIHPMAKSPTLGVTVERLITGDLRTRATVYVCRLSYGPVTVTNGEYAEDPQEAYWSARDEAQGWCERLYRHLTHLEHHADMERSAAIARATLEDWEHDL